MMKTNRRDINYRILNYVKKNQVILSMGCGSGEMEGEIKSLGNSVYGMDIDAELIKNANKKIDKAIIANIEKIDSLPFDNNFFDVIIFADVLEHLTDPVKVLKQTKKHLKPDGYIIASIPNIANWQIRFDLLFGRFNYDSYGILDRSHLKFYTLSSAKKLFEESGYKVSRVDCTTNLLSLTYKNFLNKTKLSLTTNSSDDNSSVKKDKKSFIRLFFKKILENSDYFLAKNLKGLLAYQFILIGEKNSDKIA